MKNLVILSAARTPIGSFLGKLSSLSAPALGSVAIKAALERAGVAPGEVEQVVFGNVLQAGLGQAPARQAALGAGIPNTVPCVTVNKVCGSGLRAVMDVGNAIAAGEYEVAVAGGMESMSNAPYLLDKARTGLRMGNADARRLDDQRRPVGPVQEHPHGQLRRAVRGEVPLLARGAGRVRARELPARAGRQKSGLFDDEIVPVEVAAEEGRPDEGRRRRGAGPAPLEKMPTLKPAFQKDGTVTAGNASTINDGAAALVVTSEDEAKAKGWKPLARIVAYGEHGAGAGVVHDRARRGDPEAARDDAVSRSTTSTSSRSTRRSPSSRWRRSTSCSLDPAKVNVRGGAVALGHPIGASGARILTTLLHALRREGKKRGIAAICIGGGEASAMLVETV